MRDRRSAPRQRFEFDCAHDSPALARAATAEMVTALHLEPMYDDLAIVVSELVTNAVRHAQAPVSLELQANAERVTVAVADGSPAAPVARDAPDDSEGGRGMALVGLLAADTGFRAQPSGKTVWATLNRH